MPAPAGRRDGAGRARVARLPEDAIHPAQVDAAALDDAPRLRVAVAQRLVLTLAPPPSRPAEADGACLVWVRSGAERILTLQLCIRGGVDFADASKSGRNAVDTNGKATVLHAVYGES